MKKHSEHVHRSLLLGFGVSSAERLTSGYKINFFLNFGRFTFFSLSNSIGVNNSKNSATKHQEQNEMNNFLGALRIKPDFSNARYNHELTLQKE